MESYDDSVRCHVRVSVRDSDDRVSELKYPLEPPFDLFEQGKISPERLSLNKLGLLIVKRVSENFEPIVVFPRPGLELSRSRHCCPSVSRDRVRAEVHTNTGPAALNNT